MRPLRVGRGLEWPAAFASQATAALGVRGAGKSNFGRVVAEECFASGIPFVVFDPIGNWFGTRSGRDGKPKGGLAVPIFGGEHGDLPLDRTSGQKIADLVLERRLSAILDLSHPDFSETDKRRFLADFGDRLFRRKQRDRGWLLLILEEADDYAPQVTHGPQAECLAVFQRIVKRGRFKGLGALMLTQRSSAINKDLLNMIGTLVAFRTTAPHDREAAERWLKYQAQSVEVAASLPQLEDGEAWVWSPEFLKELKRVKFRRMETFDTGSTPEHGSSTLPPATLADIDVPALNAELLATIEKAKAEDPRELRRRIAELEREIRAAKAAQPPAPKAAAPKRVEIEVIKPRQVTRLAAVTRILGRRLVATEEAARVVRSTWEELAAALKRARALSGDTHAVMAVPGAPGRGVSGVGPGPRSLASAAPVVRPAPGNGRAAAPAEGLTGPEQRILDALAWLEGVGQREARQQAVAFLAGYTVGGGAFNNPRGALRVRGLIEYHGDRLALTEGGRGLARAPGEALTPEELQARVLAQLPGPEGKLLRVLLDVYPRALSNEDLAQRAGYAPNGGAYNNPRGRLRSLGLIDYQGGLVVARPVLFLQE